MGNDDRLAVSNRGRDKHSPRDDLLFKLLIPLAAIVLLAGVLFSLDNWFVRPVRELAWTPGVKVWGYPSYTGDINYYPLIRHQVNGIDFRDRVVTPELLQPARALPNLDTAFFLSCTIEPEAVRVLAECPALEVVHFKSCTLSQETIALLAELPRLWVTIDGCEMDVGHLVSRCADSRSLKALHIWGTPLDPDDFHELHRWTRLENLTLRRTDIHVQNVRDIAKTKTLDRVSFSDVELTDDVVAAIVESDAFHSLILMKTNLTEAHISQLSQCRSLQNLNIWNTNVPASAIRFLEQSQSLKRVYAAHTPLGKGIDEMVLSNGCVIQGSDWIRK